MEPYNLFSDLLSTCRSLNDGIKALRVIGFYAAPRRARRARPAH